MSVIEPFHPPITCNSVLFASSTVLSVRFREKPSIAGFRRFRRFLLHRTSSDLCADWQTDRPDNRPASPVPDFHSFFVLVHPTGRPLQNASERQVH